MSVFPIFDGHNDTLLRVLRSTSESPFNFYQENSVGHLDLPRARQGGLFGGLFAIFVPTPPGSPEAVERWEMVIDENGYRQKLHGPVDPVYARAFTESAVEALHQLVDQSDGQMRLVSDVFGIEKCLEENTLAVVMHFEGAEGIQEDLSNLEFFYRRGLRSLGIVWSRPNAFAEGVPFAFPSSPDTGPGLTAAGRALVKECNRLGIMVDLAHINEKGFWDVASISTAPLVVSHTEAHTLLPSTRNITDAQIDAVGKSGGVIGLNFEPMQIGQEGKPVSDVPLANLVRHVDHIAGRIGIDHVAFGSDFDGTKMPSELGDVAGLQKLTLALAEGGYSHEEIEKVAYRNWLRVICETWE